MPLLVPLRLGCLLLERLRLGRLRRGLRCLLAERAGNVLVLFGLAALPLVGAAGLAIDSILAYTTRENLQRSLDAAALAAGRSMEPGNRSADARSYLYSNFNGSTDIAAISSFTFTEDTRNDTVTLSATAAMPTHFMGIFGIDQVEVAASTEIKRELHQMELALVLDNTGSMAGAPFTAMQRAAKDLVDIVYGANDTHPNLFVSLVPFVAVVNVGAQHADWINGGKSTIDALPGKGVSPWRGCVLARPAPCDETDDTPSVRRFDPFRYPDDIDNDWGAPRSPAFIETAAAGNGAYGPNLGCGQAILPLTASKATVQTALDAMTAWARGGTAGNEGTAWAWRVLSPKWRGLWGGDTPADRPFDYDPNRTDKVVVILTDGANAVFDWPSQWFPSTYADRQGRYDYCGGEAPPSYNIGAWRFDFNRNNKYDKATDDCPFGTTAAKFQAPGGSDYTAYRRLWDFAGAGATVATGRTIFDQKQARLCAKMKAEKIIIYSITFGSAPDAQAKTLYQNCASKPEFYFHSPDNARLRTVFRTIGQQLSSLRISR